MLNPLRNFNLILFSNFHVIYLFGIKSLHLILSRFSFTYRRFPPNACSRQIVITIAVRSLEEADLIILQCHLLSMKARLLIRRGLKVQWSLGHTEFMGEGWFALQGNPDHREEIPLCR